MGSVENIFGTMVLMWLMAGVIGFLGFTFWVVMLFDCMNNDSFKDNEKPLWLIIIIFGNVVGALVYYLLRKKNWKEESKLSSFANFLLIIVGGMILLLIIIFILFPSIISKQQQASQKQIFKMPKSIYNYVRRTQPQPTIRSKQIPKHTSVAKAKSTELMLNRRDPNTEMDVRTNREKVELNQKKYSEPISSWVDENGKMHFTNAM